MLRLYIASSLWADSTEQHANGSLRSALWRLSRSGGQLIETDPSHVRLHPAVRVDLYDVTARARRLLGGGSAELGDFGAIVPAMELLPDHYDDWVLIERERFRQLRMHALETLCQRLSLSRRHGEAIEAGLAAVAGEPLRESAHRALICAHLAEGNRAEAIRQFERYRDIIRRDLGLTPSAEISALISKRQLELAAV
jgi:DNA-binding SARP family transcriptional activator